MALPFVWLADILRAAGLDVVEFPGWQTRTAGTRPKETWGVLCHHDAAPPSPRRRHVTPPLIAHGHSTLPGPIAQLCITDDAKVHVIAAGTANHAGKGRIPNTAYIDGNARLLGIEVNNSGLGEVWSAAVLDAYATTVAACLAQLGLDSSRAIAHKEYTARKIDPAGPWDPSWRFAGPGMSSWAQMGRWREAVATCMAELSEPSTQNPPEVTMFVVATYASADRWLVSTDAGRPVRTRLDPVHAEPFERKTGGLMIVTPAWLDAVQVAA